MSGVSKLFIAFAISCCSAAPEVTSTCRDGEHGPDGTCHTSAPSASLMQKNANGHRTRLDSAGEEVRVDEQTAQMRDRARARLFIEQDFSKLGEQYYRTWRDDESCDQNSNNVFTEFVEKNRDSMHMTDDEIDIYQVRFLEEMRYVCKHDPNIVADWHSAIAGAAQHEKPIMTEALADVINNADLGFAVVMNDRLLHESTRTFEARLGKVVTPEENATMYLQTQTYLQRSAASRRRRVPSTFDPTEQWPACADVITRGHNQGVCGSCWAFGSLSALDSRLCIASDGVFQGQLSRGYTASCGTSNGCAGGLSSLTYNLAASSGIPTGGNGGCSPYFARGEGTDHFEQSMPSPPCPDQCHNEGGYARSLPEDRFVLPSIGAFQEIWPTNADGNGDAKVSMLNHGPVPFGIYANQALMGYDSGIFSSGCGGNPNHEVVAIGWGDGYFQALNSWGSHWGENGGMRVADCIVTDWTIPSDITQDIPLQPLPLPGQGDGPVPTPAPTGTPPIASSSWEVVEGSCGLDGDGCITSPNWPEQYANSQSCTIRPSTGSTTMIDVVEFATESNFDKLEVNGEIFHGAAGPHHVSPTTDIIWESDSSMEAKGWRLCPNPPFADTSQPTAAPTAAPTSAPTSAPTDDRRRSTYPPTYAPTDAPTDPSGPPGPPGPVGPPGPPGPPR